MTAKKKTKKKTTTPTTNTPRKRTQKIDTTVELITRMALLERAVEALQQRLAALELQKPASQPSPWVSPYPSWPAPQPPIMWNSCIQEDYDTHQQKATAR